MKKLSWIIGIALLIGLVAYPVITQVTRIRVDTLFVAQKPWVDVTSPEYDQDNDGVCEAADISAAESYADNAGNDLYFPTGTYTLDANVSISSNVNVKFSQGAVLAQTASATFTIQ